MLGASLGAACVPVHLRMRSFLDQLAPSPPSCPGTAPALQVTSHHRGCLVGSQTARQPVPQLDPLFGACRVFNSCHWFLHPGLVLVAGRGWNAAPGPALPEFWMPGMGMQRSGMRKERVACNDIRPGARCLHCPCCSPEGRGVPQAAGGNGVVGVHRAHGTTRMQQTWLHAAEAASGSWERRRARHRAGLAGGTLAATSLGRDTDSSKSSVVRRWSWANCLAGESRTWGKVESPCALCRESSKKYSWREMSSALLQPVVMNGLLD